MSDPGASGRDVLTAGEPASPSTASTTLEDDSRSGWIAAFAVLLACQTLIFVAFSSVLPFLPLYLRELGESETGAAFWAGMIQAGTGVSLLIVSPIWGSIADRVGQRAMLMRGLFIASVAIGLLTFAREAWHVFVLRVLLGASGGVTSTTIALGVAILPAARLSLGMGLIQTSQSIGNALGPLAGSVGSSTLGFKGTFVASGMTMLLLVAAVWLFVREPSRSRQRSTVELGAMERLALIVRARRLQAPILATLTYQAAFMLSSTLVALHMEQLAGGTSDATVLVGLAFTVNALGLAVGGAVFGWLAGRFGDVRMSLIALILMAAVTIPQTFVSSTVVLVVLRAVTGFAAGGVLPALRAHLAREASLDPATSNSLGAVYGVAQSSFAGGVTLGPALASAVAVYWGIPNIHLASGILLVATAIMYFLLVRRVEGSGPETAG